MDWIKVEDQLPDDISFIIAYGKRFFELELDGTEDEEPNSVWNAVYMHGCFYSFCADYESQMDQMKASHWMPLPKGPDK